MPLLKNLLGTIPIEKEELANLRFLTIECIGYLASAMKGKPEIFKNDVHEIMGFLSNLQNAGNLAQDDKYHEAIINVYSRFASCLKAQFEIYMPIVFPKIARAVSLKVELLVQDETDPNYKEEKEDSNSKVKKKYLTVIF